MKKLNDSNREEALNYVVELYTLLLGEPDYKEAKDLKAVHLKQLKKFTMMFDRAGEGYLVKEGLSRQANSSEKVTEAIELRGKNTILFNNGKRTKASQVETLEFPAMFQPKKPEEPKDDDDEEDDDKPIPMPTPPTGFGSCGASTPSASTPSVPPSGAPSATPSVPTAPASSTSSVSSTNDILTEKELVENIKKIKDIKDEILFPTIESLILGEKFELGSSLQEKLEYMGFDGYDKFKISDTTNTEMLTKDIINSFMFVDLNNKSDVKMLEFAIKKVPQFKEWNEFITKIK